jgi:hypothetical protein
MTLLILGGCASQEIKVSCDGKLQPINAPSSTAKVLREGGGGPVAVAQAAGDKKP